MTAERATGLSTAAIEHCLACWDDAAPLDAEIPAARAELAALTEQAGRATALAGALRHIVDYYAGASEDDLPFAVILAQRALEADAGPGAAGARDDPMSFETFVAWLGPAGLAICARGGDAARRTGEWAPLEPTGVIERWLDALRAGGAGEGGKDDG